MAARSLADAVTESFYTWEIRGRGWMLADYPVSLEPPFRPLLFLPLLREEHATSIDDGKRPTFASALIDRAKRLLGGASRARAVATPFEEEPPYPAFPRGCLAPLRLIVPVDSDARPEVIGQLWSALSAALHPLSFEIIGAAGNVALQLVCADTDHNGVQTHLEAFLPEIAVTIDEDLLSAAWNSDAFHAVVDVGLAHEFFLPLPGAGSPIDLYAALIPALAQTRSDEFLMLQVLVEGVRNPWKSAVDEALDDGAGGCVIADASWFLSSARAKTNSPLYAVVMRIVAQAETAARAWELVQSTQAFLLQFANPSGNALVPLANDSYPDDAHAWAVCERQSFRTGMILSADELVALCHLPDQSVRHPALTRMVKRTVPLPATAHGRALSLGEHEHHGRLSTAGLDLESRFAHLWIVGGSGTGKSTLMTHLVLEDIANGHGILVLDPHGDLIDDIVARIPDDRLDTVIRFDPSDEAFPVGFNILNARTDIERNLLASDLVAIVRRFATSWGDTMSTVLGEAVLALLAHPSGGTLVDLRRFLLDDGARKKYLAAIPDPDIRSFWEKDYPLIGSRSIGPLISRLDTFLRARIIRNIVGQQGGKLDLGEAMRSGKVVLARLAKGLIGEEHASLLGSLLIAKLNQLALARQADPPSARRPFFCYADEFQNFVTPSMESLATEGRKYRLGLILAHQMLAQLSEVPRIEGALLSNCHTRVVFRVGEHDARKFADGFASFDASDLATQRRGEAIVRIGSAADNFNLRTLPLARVDDDVAEARRHTVIAHTRTHYALPRDDVADILARAYADNDERRASPEGEKENAARVVVPVTSAPENTPPAERKKKTATTPADPLPASGRGGEMHKYLQHLVKRLAEERGFRATIEGVAGYGQADVVLHRDDIVVGCEISITTDAAHEKENLQKCLAAGFTRIFFISPEKKQRDKIAALLRKDLAGAPISVLAPEDIVTAIDALGIAPTGTESVVRGYKVKVTRQMLSPDDEVARRKAVAGVIARTIERKQV
ncbi:MAG: type IV secretory system conjugative DNA transfer family protein [Leptothrix sp. (in: b-proteobacteria)]